MNEIPQKPSENVAAEKMLTDTYTGLGIPPSTSMWTLPRKPLNAAKSGGKTSHSTKGHGKPSKAYKPTKPKKQQPFPETGHGFY